MTSVLYTGGAGRMGRVIREGLAGRYERVVLYVRKEPVEPLFANEVVVVGDLSDLETLKTAVKGIDVIVHLGAIADEESFERIREANIDGTYNVYEAARLAGVRRVVFASSNHIIGFHPASERLDETASIRPDTYYGVSKAFGEALASLYSDKWGVESVLLRIGTFRPAPEDVRQLALWLSWRDGIELTRCAIENGPVRCQVVYGVSANADGWWNAQAGWAAIGFTPQDNAAEHAQNVDHSVPAPKYHGGAFTASEYQGGIW
ncbi:NAD(P)-dependent oxidoreductase [Pseudoclavibacter sp. AY1F1]|uniref:NAD-dependent epimerase/dehydratase family protein n=1 Tax=Pseudoclavibacter sp. AY1F1 TaxID=2080583 RepID=UPI000CE7DD13|nr:NAD(P)-dependent oxidoreductase [Pseudoclavibacter sp. AY1F1]PPF45590.1 NAD(P)-dependent oxidoreductase [Pseudoclavibacter sp. AY1F1]